MAENRSQGGNILRWRSGGGGGRGYTKKKCPFFFNSTVRSSGDCGAVLVQRFRSGQVDRARPTKLQKPKGFPGSESAGCRFHSPSMIGLVYSGGGSTLRRGGLDTCPSVRIVLWVGQTTMTAMKQTGWLYSLCAVLYCTDCAALCCTVLSWTSCTGGRF